ncbi:MAG: ribonuclease Z [Eubacterium sp.]|nr:ribonuclease Z [Eubacterium sp.]
MLDIALLGTGGMMPLPNRWLTSLLVRLNGRMILLDCGEGTQVTAKLMGWGFINIDVILITHFHADHISGLPGMLLMIGNSGRTEPLKIIGPKGLKAVVGGLRVIAPVLPFEIELIEIEGDRFETELCGLNVKALKLNHRVPCYGYSFELFRKGRFSPERAKENDIPLKYWSRLQKEDTVITDEGRVLTSNMVLGPDRKGLKVSYTTDTRPTEEIPDFIRGADLFICEGMYGDEEKLEKVTEKKHMLFSEAARLAAEGEVKELWLTHYSPALMNPKAEVGAARAVFKNTKAAADRYNITLKFQDE